MNRIQWGCEGIKKHPFGGDPKQKKEADGQREKRRICMAGIRLRFGVTSNAFSREKIRRDRTTVVDGHVHFRGRHSLSRVLSTRVSSTASFERREKKEREAFCTLDRSQSWASMYPVTKELCIWKARQGIPTVGVDGLTPKAIITQLVAVGH